jgi:hypothetical protein
MVRGYVGHAPMSIHFFGKFAGILAPFLFQYFFFFFFSFFLGEGVGGGGVGGVGFLLFTYYTVPSWKSLVSS